jgi:hypothetical protein
VFSPGRFGFLFEKGGFPKGDVLMNFIPKDMKSWSLLFPWVVPEEND